MAVPRPPTAPVQPPPSFAQSLELFRRARAGDARALEDLLARYSDRLLARVRLMMGEEARAQAESSDFLQQTLLEVVRDLDFDKLNDERAFLRWSTAIARNRIRDAVRKRREASFGALSRSLSGELPRGRQDDPAGLAARNEQAHRLAEAIEELEPRLRRAIELRDFEGQTLAEVGLALGCDEEHARWLHRKALLRLGSRLQREA